MNKKWIIFLKIDKLEFLPYYLTIRFAIMIDF